MIILINAITTTGKTLLIKNLMKKDKSLFFSVSATTRTPRPGEIHGKHYYFLSHKEFDELEKNGEFFETVNLYGNKYGTFKKDFEMEDSHVIFDLDLEGCQRIYQAFPHKTIKIMLLPPNLNTVLFRLSQRNCSSSALKRIKETPSQLENIKFFDYIIINNRGIHYLVDEVLKILEIEKIKYYKPWYHIENLKKEFNEFIENHCIYENNFNLTNFKNLYDNIIPDTNKKDYNMPRKKNEIIDEKINMDENNLNQLEKKEGKMNKKNENFEENPVVKTSKTKKNKEILQPVVVDDEIMDDPLDVMEEFELNDELLTEFLDSLDDELLDKLREELIKREKYHPNKEFHSHSHRKPMDRGSQGRFRRDDRGSRNSGYDRGRRDGNNRGEEGNNRRGPRNFADDRGGRGFGRDRDGRGFGGDRGGRNFGGDRGGRNFGGDRRGRGFGGDRSERSFGGDRGGRSSYGKSDNFRRDRSENLSKEQDLGLEVSGNPKTSYNFTRITNDRSSDRHPKRNYESTNKFKSHKKDFDKPTRGFRESKNSVERGFKGGTDQKKDFGSRERSNSYKSKIK